MEEMRKGKIKIWRIYLWIILYISLALRDSRNECDAVEKRLEIAYEEQQKSLNEFKEKVKNSSWKIHMTDKYPNMFLHGYYFILNTSI